MKIYTRGGDRGETSLFGGERVRKHHLRVCAYGDVDELNAAIGMARTFVDDADLADALARIQSSLFDLGGELATPDAAQRAASGKVTPCVAAGDVEQLEYWIDRLDEELEPLRNFVLPGGARSAASLHVARTICRRAERSVVALAESEPIGPVLVEYLNRLSDLLFVMARAANRRASIVEPIWSGRQR
jgi:cob(I)alamin adenosyltransferase